MPRVPGPSDLAFLRLLKTAGAGPALARAPCPAGKRALRATARAGRRAGPDGRAYSSRDRAFCAGCGGMPRAAADRVP